MKKKTTKNPIFSSPQIIFPQSDARSHLEEKQNLRLTSLFCKMRIDGRKKVSLKTHLNARSLRDYSFCSREAMKNK